jgi:TPR repeat protein
MSNIDWSGIGEIRSRRWRDGLEVEAVHEMLLMECIGDKDAATYIWEWRLEAEELSKEKLRAIDSMFVKFTKSFDLVGYFRDRAEAEVKSGQYWLAVLYCEGWLGCPKDEELAAEWMIRAHYNDRDRRWHDSQTYGYDIWDTIVRWSGRRGVLGKRMIEYREKAYRWARKNGGRISLGCDNNGDADYGGWGQVGGF